MTEHLVKPTLPTILGSQMYYELLPLDLLFTASIETVHVIPGEIDTTRFISALSHSLSIYPLAAGRFQQARDSADKWKIHLVNAAVPVKFVETDNDLVMPTNHVIQNKGVAALVDDVKISKILELGSDEPLIRFKVTKFIKLGVTAIGLSQHHSIGDGYAVLNFLRLISQTYQGLPSLDPPPCYEFPFPSIDRLHNTKYPEGTLHAFHLESPFSVGGPRPFMGKLQGKLTRVDIHFPASMVNSINEAVTSLAKSRDVSFRFSKQDTLIALLARTLTRMDPENTIQYILNFFMYRGIGCTPMNAACNANLGPITERFNISGSDESIESIAKAVRLLVNRCRDPEFLEALMAKSGQLVEGAAHKGMTVDVTPTKGMMDINSTWKFDWTSAHFGYSSKTRFFHTILEEPRWVKIVQPNPTLASDGSWAQHSGSAEVTLYILKGCETSLSHSISTELAALGINEKLSVQFS